MKTLIATACLTMLAACGSSSKASGGPVTQTLKVTISKAGCAPPAAAKPGRTKFEVTNDGTDDITELELMSGNHVVGEKEDLTPGLSGSFTVTLKTGTYTTKCPGGSGGTLTVGG